MNTYEVKYSRQAIADINSVYDDVYDVYEASRDDDVSQRYVDDLMDTIEAKAEIPKSGTPSFYCKHRMQYN